MLTLQVADEQQQTSRHDQVVPVEPVPQKFSGEIGACVSPYVSARPTLQDWLMYHRSLGVSDFYVYCPEGKFVDYLIELYSREPGVRTRSPPTPFFSRSIWWHRYFPSSHSAYFGQVITYNDCVYRNRRRHNYLLVQDMDEFLSVNGSLVDLLHQVMPATVAALMLPVSWYRVDCPIADSVQTYSGYDVMGSVLPDLEYFTKKDRKDWYRNAKAIIRPLDIWTQYVHTPLEVVSSAKRNAWLKHLEPSMAAIKHLRCKAARPAGFPAPPPP